MAVAACPADWTVEAVLPFPKDEYLKDFETIGGRRRPRRARRVLDEPRARRGRDRAADAAGARPGLRRRAATSCSGQIDVLIAVWDGAEPKPGGTGAIAQEACERRHPGGVDRDRRRSPDRADRIIPRTTSRFAAAAWSEQTLQASARSDPGGAVGGRVRRGVRSASGSSSSMPRAGPGPRCASSFDLLKRWATGQRPLRLDPPVRAARGPGRGFREFVDDAPAAGTVEPAAQGRAGAAPCLGRRTGGAFLASLSQRLCALLSPRRAAVLIAVVGRLCRERDPEAPAGRRSSCSSSSSSSGSVRYGSKNAWHERWIDYRLVAESLRYARFLAYVSEFGLVNARTSPASLGRSGTSARACARSGCPARRSTAPISGRCCNRCCAARCESNAIGTKTTSTRWQKLDHFLHSLGGALLPT